MSPRKNDLVICLETGAIGVVLSKLPAGKLKIDFLGEIVMLDKEDVIVLTGSTRC